METHLSNWHGRWAKYFQFDSDVEAYLNGLAPYPIPQMSGGPSPPPDWIISPEVLANCKADLFLPSYWHQRLKNHLATSEVSSSVYAMLATGPVFQAPNADTLLHEWSFPVISTLLPIWDNGRPIEIRCDSIAAVCWKKWFLANDKQPLWLFDTRRASMPNAQFIIWKLIHEATHLLHLQNFPDAGNIYDPVWRLQMESVAMAAEYLLLDQLTNHVQLPAINELPTDSKPLVTILLWGFFERSLRFQFDLEVNTGNIDSGEWVAQQCLQYHLPQKFFAFANEFEGMPGFLAGYLFGLSSYLATANKMTIFNGSTKFFNYDRHIKLHPPQAV